jgi:DNA-binding NarL/FixJ family response regulator
MSQLFPAGFDSHFPQQESLRELLTRLREDLAALESAGEAPQLSRTLLSALRLILSGSAILHAPAQAHTHWAISSHGQWDLTARQREVLALLIEGKSNKEICRELGLAEGTVKIHVSAILRALKVTNRTQVVLAVTKRSNSPAARIV